MTCCPAMPVSRIRASRSTKRWSGLPASLITARSQNLDEQAVITLATPANLIIAHNAAFDRCFLERRFPLFIDKPWACSMGQVPWAEEGLGSAKLDYLLNRFGFFFDDHRAMADCRAVLHLLSLRLPHSGRPILPLLLATARRRTFRLWALEAPIECKDLLKDRGYRWNSGSDGRPRAWYRDLDRELLVQEELFLAEKVYGGPSRHELIRIDYSNRFSDRVDHQRASNRAARAGRNPGIRRRARGYPPPEFRGHTQRAAGRSLQADLVDK